MKNLPNVLANETSVFAAAARALAALLSNDAFFITFNNFEEKKKN